LQKIIDMWLYLFELLPPFMSVVLLLPPYRVRVMDSSVDDWCEKWKWSLEKAGMVQCREM